MSESEQSCYDCENMDIPDGQELCYSRPGLVKPVGKKHVKNFYNGNCPEFTLVTYGAKMPATEESSRVKCTACGKDDCASGVVYYSIAVYDSNRVRFKHLCQI